MVGVEFLECESEVVCCVGSDFESFVDDGDVVGLLRSC